MLSRYNTCPMCGHCNKKSNLMELIENITKEKSQNIEKNIEKNDTNDYISDIV